MKSIMWSGAILTLLGIIGLAIPVFTTSQTRDVAKLGDIKVQSNVRTTHVVPQLLSGGALILGSSLSARERSRNRVERVQCLLLMRLLRLPLFSLSAG